MPINLLFKNYRVIQMIFKIIGVIVIHREVDVCYSSLISVSEAQSLCICNVYVLCFKEGVLLGFNFFS